MRHLGRFTKTPYLLLFILLGAVGVGTAYAIATITIAGNLLVTGDTELDGKLIDTNNEAGTSGQVLSSTETGIDWIDVPPGATERVITYSGAETNPGGTDLVLGTVNSGAETFIGCSSAQCVSYTSMHTIPDGATLTKLECFFKDPDAGSNIFCRLQRGQTTGMGFNISALLGTSVSSPNVQSLSDTFNHVVDRSANNYHIVWQSDPSCTTCRIIAVQVTYTEQ